MDMEKINEKLNRFTEIVLQEASRKAGTILEEARREKKEKLEEMEITFLKGAYQKIHEALAEIEKESNSTYSCKLLEAKRILYNKRNEIMDKVFDSVLKKLREYRKTDEYAESFRLLVEKGLTEVGDGKIRIIVDEEDLPKAEVIMNNAGKEAEVAKGERELLGGCIIINETCGLLIDYSYITRLEAQKKDFLEFSGLNVDL